MKKITLLAFLLCNLIMLGQEYQIQIRLVDSEVGRPTGNPIDDDYEAVSDDPGLNAIFQNYNATHYYPGYDFDPEWENRTHFVLCDGCDVNQFEQDLLDYNTVIAGTFQSEPGLTANNLYVKLLDANNGNPTGEITPNGNIITTNAAINALFETYNVVFYEYFFGEVHYTLGCNCQAADLLNELTALTDVVDYSERVGYAILDTPTYNKQILTLSPNPVENNMIINSSEKINSYEIVNTLGQSIFKGNSSENINEFLPSLAQGTYLLNVITGSGKQETLRFIKK